MRHRRHDRRLADLRLGQLGHRPAVAQHEDAVGALDHLLELGGDHQHAEPLIGELADQRLDLGLGADVDAARRLVEDQELRVHAQPAGEQHLLLIAAGQLADLLLGARALDAEPRDEAVDDLALPGLVDDAGARQLRQQRQRQVLAHRHVGDDALDLAVLGAEADAGGDAPPTASRSARSLPPNADRAAVGRSAPKIARAISVRPEPSRPGEPDDLAGAHLDRHVAHLPADLEMVGLQQLAADRVRWPWKAVAPSAPHRREIAAEHRRDQLRAWSSRPSGATATVRPSRIT